jgi:hypothetical protein
VTRVALADVGMDAQQPPLGHSYERSFELIG